MNKQNKQRGYTLAEVLVALAIFAIIFLAALTAYDRSNRVFRTGVESSNMQQNTRVAFDKLVADLRMAGYDFDRDGIPTGSVGGTNEYQQPDEQFEYIGPAAMTIRGNFDYEAENTPCGGAVTDNCDNGVENLYKTTQFPVVTTGNDEIVTYALVPDSQGAVPATCGANDCIQFYADTHVPRRSYPDVPNGGQDEDLVQIKGVDPCINGCNNPPYTLYRFTLDRSVHFTGLVSDVTRTPLASNIRSMQFTYYQDGQGTDPLKDLNNVADVSTGAAILGKGQYKVSNPLALVAERDIRSKINSVRVTLVGMNESRDAAYTDTAETITGGPGYFEQYRKYRLETLVSPRNIQKRGMREQDTFPPGPPSAPVICTGACGGVYLSWTAPMVNAVQGAPDQYKVIYDTAASPGFNCETTTFTNTFAHVYYQPSMPPSCKFDPTQTYKFAVVALNSYGSRTGPQQTAQPLNATQPEAPDLQSATTNLNGKVTMTWRRPQLNIAGVYSCGPQAPPNPAELQGYLVERESPAGSGNWVPLVPAGGQVTTSSPYDTVTWSDTTAENCVDYNYRVTAIEACNFNPAWNAGNNASLGRSPASNVRLGSAFTTYPPETPSLFLVDTDPVNSPCVGGICQVHMYFQPSINDVPPAPPANPITITQYTIYRRQVGVTPFTPLVNPVTGTTPTIPNAVVNASGQIEYLDPNVDISTGQTYEYYVVAHSRCPIPVGTDSAPFVPARPFPCNFPALVVGSPLIQSSAFDGNGTLASPYKFDTNANASVNVLVGGNASLVPSGHVTARNYLGGTQQWQATCPIAPCVYSPAPGPPMQPYYTFAWTMTPNATERLDVVVVENGGCVTQGFAYFQDEPQNCCLWPESAGILPGGPPANPPVIGFSSGQDFVDVRLQNICSEPLTITGLTFTWSNANTQPGTKLDEVWVPTTSGGCSQGGMGANCARIPFSPSVTQGTYTIPAASLPGNIAPVGIGSTRYTVRVHFTKSINNPNQPITAFSVDYTKPTPPGSTGCRVK